MSNVSRRFRVQRGIPENLVVIDPGLSQAELDSAIEHNVFSESMVRQVDVDGISATVVRFGALILGCDAMDKATNRFVKDLTDHFERA